jgi:ferrous iron transport protein B
MLETVPRSRKIVLVGNPNVGKSVVFQALTGQYAEVSNYPGTTVELTTGKMGPDLVIDSPGVYGISALNDEERVTRDVVLGADLIVNIVDAVHLERDLFLTLHLADLGLPMVIGLNLMDEATARGRRIDHRRLSELLGLDVVPMVATRREGIGRLRRSLADGRQPLTDPWILRAIAPWSKTTEKRPLALLAAEGDPDAAASLGLSPGALMEESYLRRRASVDALCQKVIADRPGRSPASLLSGLMIRPVPVLVILGLVLVALYWFVGIVVVQRVVDFTEGRIMQGYYEPTVRNLLRGFLAEDGLIWEVLAGEFGLATMAVTYLFGLLLPLVAGFYLFLGLLEDSGYLPRVAVLQDRALSSIGLNGRAVIPIILGFGCVTMATLSTRVLGTRRERVIATFLLAVAIPCSAQIGIIAGLLGSLGPGFFALYLGIIAGVFVLAGTLLARFLPGASSPLFLDLPPLRWPSFIPVLRKTSFRAINFIREAAPLFVYGALLVTVLKTTGFLGAAERWMAPLVTGWLGLPASAARAFIMGIVRRDFGAAGVHSLVLAPEQMLVAAVTLTLFVPCLASIMVITKERGKLEGALIWGASILAAFGVGGMVARLR